MKSRKRSSFDPAVAKDKDFQNGDKGQKAQSITYLPPILAYIISHQKLSFLFFLTASSSPAVAVLGMGFCVPFDVLSLWCVIKIFRL